MIALLLPLAFLVPAAARQASAGPAAPPALREEFSIELPDVYGRIDHLALDPAGKRLFVAALASGTLEVVDLEQRARVRQVKGLAEPQGVACARSSATADVRVLVGCGGSGTLEVLDAASLERVQSVALGADVDNVRWDAERSRAIVGYGAGALAIVTAPDWKVAARIELGAHPESFQIAPGGKRAFVNLPDAHVVAVVDLEERRVLGKLALEQHGNFPMTLLDSADELAVGCRSPARLVFVSTTGAHPNGELDLTPDVDDLFFDAARRRIYAACGGGFLDVYDRRSAPVAAGPTTAAAASTWDRSERIRLPRGARTCLFDPDSARVFVAVPREGERLAAIRVLVAPH
jgi:hypothetical protein